MPTRPVRRLTRIDGNTARKSCWSVDFAPGQVVAELDVVRHSGQVHQLPAGISADGCTLYFASTRDGKSYGAYRATRGK